MIHHPDFLPALRLVVALHNRDGVSGHPFLAPIGRFQNRPDLTLRNPIKKHFLLDVAGPLETVIVSGQSIFHGEH